MTDEGANEPIQYKTMTVKSIRGLEDRTVSKWEQQGWELVSQSRGLLQTQITLRKPKTKTPWRLIGIVGGAVVLIAAVFIVLGVAGVFGSGAVNDAAPASSLTRSQAASSQAPSPSPSPSVTKAPAILTSDNNPDLAALLKVGDASDGAVEAFATKYAGQTISFDGSISALAPHGNDTTRYDIGIGAGDDGGNTAFGPSFQFRDVNTTSDLHYSGPSRDAIGVGTKVTVTAVVGSYDPDTTLFQLTPVKTVVR